MHVVCAQQTSCSLPFAGYNNDLAVSSFLFYFHHCRYGFGRLAMVSSSLPWASDALARRVLSYTQVAYPIVLLFVYLIAFTVRSIATARNDNDTPETEQLGQVDRQAYHWRNAH